MIRKISIIVLIAFLGLAESGNYDTNAKIKAVYLYNFTKYIEWPKEYREDVFVIGVVGDSPLIKELETMATTKKVLGQSIVVKKFQTASEINQCHILYHPSDSKVSFSEVAGKIDGFSTLLVTDTPGMAQKGAAINFVVLQNRQKFELNKSNAVKYNLKVSNSLEALAIIVN